MKRVDQGLAVLRKKSKAKKSAKRTMTVISG